MLLPPQVQWSNVQHVTDTDMQTKIPTLIDVNKLKQTAITFKKEQGNKLFSYR